MNRLFPAALAAIAAAGFTALPQTVEAQVTKRGQAYLLRAKFTKGQTLRYQMNMSMAGGGQTAPQKMDMPMTMKVKDIVKGVADIDATVGPVTMTGQQLVQAQTHNIKMDGRGKVVGGQAGMGGVGATLPEKPLKVGESYTAVLPIAQAGGGGGQVTATYKFMGLKTVDGKSVAELRVSLQPSGRTQVSGGGTIHLMANDCSLHKANLDLQMQPPAPQGRPGAVSPPMKINVAMKRV